MHRSGPS
ncbi:hypothetical protein YPPY66_3109, partial [Yersinia pestis PY-66]